MKKIPAIYSLFIFSFAFALLIVSCRETLDNVTYSSPELEIDTERQLTINVIEPDGSPLTGYDLLIEGPTTVSESAVGQSEYVFDDLASGTYTISITREQYISESVSVDIQLPEEADESYYDEITVALNERTPPVTFNNSEESVIETAPSAREQISGEPATFIFPANTFPEELEDEDGNVSISVTRASPADINNAFDEGTVKDLLEFEPGDIDLNEESTVEFPVAIPEELFDDQTEDLGFTLQPGNIPVELIEVETVSSLQANFNTFRKLRLRTKLNRLQRYHLVPNRRVTKSTGFTEYRQVGRSACGEPVTVTIETETGVPGPAARALLKGPFVNRTVTQTRTFDGIPGARTTVEVQNRTITYTVTGPGNRVIEEITVLTPKFSIRVTLNNCHDSGGG
jgi:hypothetical protein